MQQTRGTDASFTSKKYNQFLMQRFFSFIFRHMPSSDFGYMVFSSARECWLNFRWLWEQEKLDHGFLGSSFLSTSMTPMSQSKQNLVSPDLAFNPLGFLQNKENGSFRTIKSMSFQGYFTRKPSHRLPLLEFPFRVGKMGTKGTWSDVLTRQRGLGMLGSRQLLIAPEKCSSASLPSP